MAFSALRPLWTTNFLVRKTAVKAKSDPVPIKAPTPPTKPKSKPGSLKAKSDGYQTPPNKVAGVTDDLSMLGLDDEQVKMDNNPLPAMSMKQAELIEKIKQEEENEAKKRVSLVVVGHVDAGKSTLMGRMLYELGDLSDKEKTANERGSQKVGKSSFALAWGLDALGDERDRGVTIDIATSHFDTANRSFTLLDAPGHQDFIPNMISGASQADLALLVVDASPGEFEAGFDRGGQTREHALLVRALGVRQLIVGVNKMDVVEWSQDRFEDIQDSMKPFLQAAGFAPEKTVFVPVAAMAGVNLAHGDELKLKAWYNGPTLVDILDKVDVPRRPLDAPLRYPISNVFKGQSAVSSGVGVSGRLCSGVVQVGERLRILPGDETAVVRTIEREDETVPYASAGQNVNLYLAGIDPIHLSIGAVLCPLSDPVPLATKFRAQILVFDIAFPLIAGVPLELFHHSNNVPATLSKLISVISKGATAKPSPRVLQKGVHAEVEITLRAPTQSSSTRAPVIPLEPAHINKEMGRILLRRGGETVAAVHMREAAK
ncbi:hypothetical protein QFC21_001335 [Naganishia friedmannii]|uniref:Uncharacterized protein n=1 Tax=Naganishia friedmannii TaxID=89922 RepID=A0ACC2W474_9TREE|nr:hypothetical protein QFC21_001335 [Naganishia friedmannii]